MRLRKTQHEANQATDDLYTILGAQQKKTEELQQQIKSHDKMTEQLLLQQKLHLEATFKLEEQSIRRDAIQKAKVVNKGFDGETFSPILQSQWNPKDFRHLGTPIDFIVLAGAEDVRSSLADDISEIVLLEVKTGESDLSTVQRRIRDAVVANKVKFGLYNLETKTIRTWSPEDPKGKNVITQVSTSG